YMYRRRLTLLSLIQPPPPATRFPYTTLFRSRHDAVARRRYRTERLFRSPLPDGPALLRRLHRADGNQGQPARKRRRRPDGAPRQDRKSTRLSSSHVKISYAVFCLKKKTNADA